MTTKGPSMSSPKRELLASGTRVKDYIIIKRIGSGGYGDIYAVRDTLTDPPETFAMKIEYPNTKHSSLPCEVQILVALQHSPYFPKLIEAGTTNSLRWLVMELLGPSVSATRRFLPSHRYAAYSVLQLSYEMLSAIYVFHEQGFVHRDIKPGNFLIRPDRRHPICLIDYGLSYSYRQSDSRTHIPFEFDVGFTGTYRYASLHAQNGLQLSRRDDLISWFYSVMELASGHLPWPGSADRQTTASLKATLGVEQLCEDLPIEFMDIYKYINTLEFETKPNYRLIARKIRRAIKVGDFANRRFDWEFLPPETVQQFTIISLEMGPEDCTATRAIPVGMCGCCGCCE
jgi:serine/threonine protein kinase